MPEVKSAFVDMHRGSGTHQETSTNEHSDILGCCLKRNTDEHDCQSDDDGYPSSSPIGKPWGNWNSHNGADRHNGVEQTQRRG